MGRHVGARVLSDVQLVGADQFVVDDELREGVVCACKWRGGDCQGQELVAVELHCGWMKALPEFSRPASRGLKAEKGGNEGQRNEWMVLMMLHFSLRAVGIFLPFEVP